MLQTSLTNLRTLSFAFVMAAMLMVGTMTPVHQVAAQEASNEQRAAMLAQINQLMQLITQLMAQVEALQSGAITQTPVDITKQESKREYRFSPLDRQVRPGDDLRVGQLHAPDTGDEYRYLDYLAVSVVAQGDEKPWKTFDSVTLGIPVRELTFDMSRPDAW